MTKLDEALFAFAPNNAGPYKCYIACRLILETRAEKEEAAGKIAAQGK